MKQDFEIQFGDQMYKFDNHIELLKTVMDEIAFEQQLDGQIEGNKQLEVEIALQTIVG